MKEDDHLCSSCAGIGANLVYRKAPSRMEQQVCLVCLGTGWKPVQQGNPETKSPMPEVPLDVKDLGTF